MRYAFLLPLVLAAALSGCGTGKAANDNGTLPALTGRVVDNADLLPPEAEARITGRLAALEEHTTDQLIVVTVPSLRGEPIEDLGVRLGRGWGIGQKDLNNGVLLIVAPAERRVRIEVGTGLEGLLTDDKAATIIKEQLLPGHRDARHADAIAAGVEALVGLLEQDRRRPRPFIMQKAA